MMSRKWSVLCSVSALALITACSSNPPRNDAVFDPAGSSSNAVTFGNVSNIEIVSVASRSSGGGAAIGNQIERRHKSDNEIYRVSVRLDTGRMAQFDYQRIDDLRVGDRVKVQDGQLHRA